MNGFSHNIFYSSIAAILNFNFRLATFLCNNCYLFVFQEQKKIPCRTLNSHSSRAKPQLFTTFLCDQYHRSDLKSGRKKNPNLEKTKLNDLEMFLNNSCTFLIFSNCIFKYLRYLLRGKKIFHVFVR